MSFYVVQGGSSIYLMTTGGTASSALTLPTGVTIDSTLRLRGAVLGQLVVLVGSPSENITVDREGVARRLTPRPPSAPPTVAAGSAGSLSGDYYVWYTNKFKDAVGNTLAESDFSPQSALVTLTSDMLRVSKLQLSTDNIPIGVSFSRQLYRSTTGGTTKFPWVEVDGNTLTSVEDDLADAGLQLIAAATDLGAPPKFELIATWKHRLWGKSYEQIDTLYQSANGKPYAFPSGRTIPIPPTNADNVGITGLMARKDALGVGKRSSIHQITGTNETNFNRSVVTEGIGVWAPDSCVVVHDVAYFLGNPFGLYTWGPGGVTNISDAKVKAWFETDTYFNRALFDDAYGWYDPTTNSYILNLAAAGSTNLDRWIQYDIATGNFWGPHKTGAFTPQGGTMLRDSNDVAMPVLFGDDGKLYKPQTTKTDGASTGIDFDVTTNFLSGNSPSIMKFWDQPDIITKILASGTLTITPKVGKLNASAGTAISHDMTLGRERLRRLGDGELCQLRFQNSTNAINTVIYGIELPFFERGRR